jgi:arylsulfatase A-like enzyme
MISTALALLAGLLAGGGERGPRPSIVWITVEDMSPWLGCYGDTTVPTPAVDALAARGTRYTHAYSSAPVCAPARATLITGCAATRTGAMHMRTGNPSQAALAADPGAYEGIPSYEATPAPEVRCFPELLRAAGYWCTNAAKTDYQFQAPPTVWDASGGKAHWRDRPDPEQPFFAVFNIGVTHESGTFTDRRRPPRVADPATVPLPPYYPDTPVVREDIARTYDNIARMDRRVAELVAELEEAGRLDSTWVFFFGDHGVGLPRGKRCLYGSGTRVPLVVVAPGGEAAVSERLVSFEDLAPTVLSIAGLEPPAWMDGRAFDGPHEAAPRELVFLHADRMDACLDRTRGVTDGRHLFLRNDLTDRPRLYPVAYAEGIPMTAELRALAAAGELPEEAWQLSDATKPPRELYDSASDPHEVVNLAGREAWREVEARLSGALEAWIEETGDLGMLPEAEMVRTRLWPPDGRQPETEPPVLVTGEGAAPRLASATEGASIGYREPGRSRWRVWTPGSRLEPGRSYEAVAHRIGFRRSEVVTLEAPATR